MNKTKKAAEAANKTYIGEATEEQINRWRAMHRKVVRIDVEDGDDVHIAYFKRPSMETMAAVTKLAKTDEMKSARSLFDGCWLGGSELIAQDAALFAAVMPQLNLVLSSVTATVKNL